MKFSDQLQSLGFATYGDYLDGEHWKSFKEKYRASGKPTKCAVCNCGPIQLHHHSYAALGSESLNDVTPLCRSHHEEVHEVLKEKKWPVSQTFKVVELIRDDLPSITAPEPVTHKKSKKTPKAKSAGKKKPKAAKIEPVKACKVHVSPKKQPRKRCVKCKRGRAICHFPNGVAVCAICTSNPAKDNSKGRKWCEGCKKPRSKCQFVEGETGCKICHISIRQKKRFTKDRSFRFYAQSGDVGYEMRALAAGIRIKPP